MSNVSPAEQSNYIRQLPVRSPRSAAIAGIIFSLLMAISMIEMTAIASISVADISKDLLETRADSASQVLVLLAFAGIAFLWFTGVIRDRMGRKEDQFFATIFLGSGIIFVALLFVIGATIGAVFGSYRAALLADNDIIIYGVSFMNEIIDNYALRMAGVYMLSIGSLWTRIDVMPRWLTILTLIVAVGFLFFSGSIPQARLIFPAWVFLVSVYVLYRNRVIGR